MATTVTDDSYSTPFATDLVVGQNLDFQQQGSAAQVTVDGWAGTVNAGSPIAFNQQGTAGSVATQGIAGTVDFGFIVGGAVSDRAEVTVTGRAGNLSGQLWQWDVPTLAEETAFYTNVMGWTIPAGAENFSGWNTAVVGFGDLHDDTEGDDLWTWDQQWKRHGAVNVPSGNNSVAEWRSAWLTEHKNNLLTALNTTEKPGDTGTGFGYDHIYGQGLAVIYNDTTDPAIPAVLDGLRTDITSVSQYQTLASGGDLSVSFWEGRGVARWTIVATYAYQATNDPAWQTVRDNLQHAYETSPDWEEGGVIRNGGGMYFASRNQHTFTSGTSTADHDAGYRYNATWSIGLMAEAVWRLYVQTGSEILRDRLIKMARYVQYYLHDPAWLFPNSGSRFGHQPDGSRWGLSNTLDGTANNAAENCSYDMSLVNVLVMGYKLTGDSNLLTFAQTVFGRGNRYDPGGTFARLSTSLSHVYKYVDTLPNTSDRQFLFNKGQLQYNYQIFENSGAPAKIDFGGTIQTAAAGMASNTWLQLPDNGLNALAFDNIQGVGLLFNYSHDIIWNANAKELHFRGGSASASGARQRHVRFNDAAGTWDAVTAWGFSGTQAHQWGHFCGDPRTGDLYYRNRGSTDIVRWDYTKYPSTGSWVSDHSGTFNGSTGAQALGFFPDLNNGIGGLVFAGTAPTENMRIWATTNAAFDSWTELNSNVFTNVSVEVLLTYLPGQKWMLFGGGKQPFGAPFNFQPNPKIGKLEADGTCTPLNNIPFNVGANNTGSITGHPNGTVLGVDTQNNNLYQYNVAGDSWSTAGLTQPVFDASHQVSAVGMIPEFDVLLVITQSSSSCEQWLYKL